MGISALRASVLSFIRIYSFSFLSAQSGRFPPLSSSLSHPDPLILLPGSRGAPGIGHPYPRCCAGECKTFLPWRQAGRRTGEGSRALALYTLLQRSLFHVDKLVEEVVLTRTRNSLSPADCSSVVPCGL